MKKLINTIQQVILIFTILCIVNLCAPLPVIVDPALAAKKVYIKDALTGGTSTSLDGISVSDLAKYSRAVAFVYDTNDRSYIFEFQASATDSEETSIHPYKIRPDDYSSAGVWYEQADGYVDRPSINLITNSSFGAWSHSTLENVGSAINITGVTNGVCFTADYEDVQIGDLVEISGTTVCEVTAVSAGVSFTVDDTTYNDSAVSGYEVTPGCIVADVYGPDDWWKTTAPLTLYRWQQDSTHCKGFYGVKVVKGANVNENIYFPARYKTKPQWYELFSGRTVTFGAWVYPVGDSDNVRLALTTSSGTTYSSYASADILTWLEVTIDVPSSLTSFYPAIYFDKDSGDVAYISQPQLSFGDSIGGGNYIQPPGEIIWLDSGVTMTDYTGGTVSADTTINIEEQTSGKIPKGIRAVYIQLTGQCANTDKYIALLSKSGGISGPRIEDILVANKNHTAVGWCPCDADGDIYIERDGTFTGVHIKILGVEIR